MVKYEFRGYYVNDWKSWKKMIFIIHPFLIKIMNLNQIQINNQIS